MQILAEVKFPTICILRNTLFEEFLNLTYKKNFTIISLKLTIKSTVIKRKTYGIKASIILRKNFKTSYNLLILIENVIDFSSGDVEPQAHFHAHVSPPHQSQRELH